MSHLHLDAVRMIKKIWQEKKRQQALLRPRYEIKASPLINNTKLRQEQIYDSFTKYYCQSI